MPWHLAVATLRLMAGDEVILSPERDSRRPSSDLSWEHFPHGADIGVRGHGNNSAQAFAAAALALTAVVAEPADVAAATSVPVHCTAPDHETLLLDWLNALVFEMADRDMLFARFDVAIEPADDGVALTAVAWGEALDRRRHRPVVEVKGATYTELMVRQDADGHWLAQCVVDV